jgi:IclR family transcriptional regulator, acetate operon repressor
MRGIAPRRGSSPALPASSSSNATQIRRPRLTGEVEATKIVIANFVRNSEQLLGGARSLMTEPDLARSSRSADRALELLKIVARSPQPIRFSDLFRVTGTPKATLHALVTSLLRSGFLEGSTSGLRLGITAFEIGTMVPAITAAREGARAALDELHRSVGHTCHFGTLVSGEVLYLDRRDSPYGLRFATRLGDRNPAYATAIGKAMLCLVPDEEVVATYPAALSPLTPNTLHTRADLLSELAEWRSRGYALESEESTMGVRCIGMATQGRSQPYGISITAPIHQVSLDQLEDMQPALALATKKVADGFAVSNWLRVDPELTVVQTGSSAPSVGPSGRTEAIGNGRKI